MKRNTNEESLKGVIDRLLKAYRLDGKMKEIDVINAWPTVLGEAVNKRTSKIFMRDGVLHVYLSSSVLREDLAMSKSKIIKSLNEEIGEEIVKDVIFK